MKYSTVLMQLLEVNDFWFLPNYPFKLSLDEQIEEVYNNNDKKDIEELENYCYYCLTNLDLLLKENCYH